MNVLISDFLPIRNWTVCDVYHKKFEPQHSILGISGVRWPQLVIFLDSRSSGADLSPGRVCGVNLSVAFLGKMLNPCLLSI